MSPLLKLSNVSKSFGPVRALSDISFELNPSEVVALVGDNGAGKSTLVKIISGALNPDEGHFWFEGAEVQIRKPEDARRLGIETVYQDLALFDNSNVAENIFAGREVVKRVLGVPFLRSSEMHARAEELLKTLKIHIQSTHYTVKGMSGGQRQSVAIARAVAFGRKVVILDEPTAALGVGAGSQGPRILDHHDQPQPPSHLRDFRPYPCPASGPHRRYQDDEGHESGRCGETHHRRGSRQALIAQIKILSSRFPEGGCLLEEANPSNLATTLDLPPGEIR
jgi:ABC-type branched-subunit amino acid transport system ATPase component